LNSKVLNYIKKNIPNSLYSKFSEIPNSIITKYFFDRKPKKRIDKKYRNELRSTYKSKIKELNKYLNTNELIDFNLLEFWGYED